MLEIYPCLLNLPKTEKELETCPLSPIHISATCPKLRKSQQPSLRASPPYKPKVESKVSNLWCYLVSLNVDGSTLLSWMQKPNISLVQFCTIEKEGKPFCFLRWCLAGKPLYLIHQTTQLFTNSRMNSICATQMNQQPPHGHSLAEGQGSMWTLGHWSGIYGIQNVAFEFNFVWWNPAIFGSNSPFPLLMCVVFLHYPKKSPYSKDFEKIWTPANNHGKKPAHILEQIKMLMSNCKKKYHTCDIQWEKNAHLWHIVRKNAPVLFPNRGN